MRGTETASLILVLAGCKDKGGTPGDTGGEAVDTGPFAPCEDEDPALAYLPLPETRYGDVVVRSCNQELMAAVAAEEGMLLASPHRLHGVYSEDSRVQGGAVFLGPVDPTKPVSWEAQEATHLLWSKTDQEYMGEEVIWAEVDGNATPDLIISSQSSFSSVDLRERDILLWVAHDAPDLPPDTSLDDVGTIIDQPRTEYDDVFVLPVSLGDVTGDGLDDITVVLNQQGLGTASVGAMPILPGPLDENIALDAWDLWVAGGQQALAYAQPTLPQHFDANGDGMMDVAPTRNYFSDEAGRMRIYYGPIDASRELDEYDAMLGALSYNLDEEDPHYGSATSFGIVAERVPGEYLDGHDGLLIADEDRDVDGVIDAGILWLAPGPFTDTQDIEEVATARVVGTENYDGMATHATVGDLDGDGQLDYIVASDDQDWYDSKADTIIDKSDDPGVRVFWGPLEGTVEFRDGVEIHARRAGPLRADRDLDGDGTVDLTMFDPELGDDDDRAGEHPMEAGLHIWLSSASDRWPRPWAPSTP